ncbi:hypothetical protein A71_195 [Escherichia phage A7_1]|uniref:Uncharacterized protein n=1 Tax=Escherichia phage A5-4 TaxID=2996162 RepID=A0AAE9Q1X5_9CAUD|nr:hypothetical protein A71_195 [Escherichia phage A7_1]UZZ64278.1 hypothetical protein A54_38 [Escherichia phage A5-4]
MKDLMGIEMKVGDKVAFTYDDRKTIFKGIITRIIPSKGMAGIEYVDPTWTRTQRIRRTSKYIVKIK